jgi:acetylglutamate kinase
MEGKDVATLLQALPYIRRLQRATIVIKCGGEVARDATARENLAQDIALCAHVGIKALLVHGGGPQATDLSRRLGVEPRIVQGRRVTDDHTLEVAKMVFGGSINLDLLGALRSQGLRPVGLSGVDADLVHAVRRPRTEVADPATGATESVDFGHVGDITDVDTRLLRSLVDEGYVPVVASLGSDAEGNIYNINADTVAAHIAMDLRADKLLLLTNAPGLLEDPADPETVVSHVSASRAEALLESGAVSGGMVPKLTTLVQAVRGGVQRAHILDGLKAHSLLVELFTKDGTGTMVTTSEEEQRYLDE